MPNRRVVLLCAALSVLAGGAVTTAAAGQPPDETAPTPVSGDPGPAAVRTGALFQAAAAPTPAEPEHTGLGALIRSTGSDFAAFPKRKSTWVILGIGGIAAGIAHPLDDGINEKLHDEDGLRRALKPGKYLGYGFVQGGAAIGLYVIGRYAMKPDEGHRTNKVSHLGFDLLRAQLVNGAFTYGIKVVARRQRPTEECCSFPSGHASVTFATASVLERHFGYRGSWPMFAIAGYVSASRITDNRHFLGDVLFGSALGIATGWTVVGRHGRDSFTLFPAPVKGGVALAGAWSPGRHHTAG